MVVAGASIVAGHIVTLALSRMAGLALPVVGALTVKIIDEVHAAPAIFTGVMSALIHIDVAQTSLPAIRTHALEGADAVDARAAILTRVTHAVIDVLMAVDTTEALVADAGEVSSGMTDAASARSAHVRGNVPHHGRVVGRHGNCAAVNHLTWGGLAALLQSGTGLPLVAFGTSAVEVLSHTVTRGFIFTRTGITRFCWGPSWDLAQLSGELGRTVTLEAVEHCAAFAVVVARLAVTLVPLDVAVGAHKARRAQAVVTPRTILASGAVLALTMTPFQIDVTVLSRPSPKTDAVISTNQIFARMSTDTGLAFALIYIYLAGLSFPLRGAHTLKAILQIDAGPPLSTWV